MSEREPPDWALPSWDSIPEEAEEGSPRLHPVGPGPRHGSPPVDPALRGPLRPVPDLPATPDRAGPSVAPPPGTFGVRIMGVSEVTRSIRGAVRSDPRLADLWVEGEIGRVTISSAGHAYFALKDERNQLQCVWFRDDRLRSAFEAQAGLRVVAHGRIDLFEPQGALQLYVESIQPAGLGDLTLRFEALKARLAAEGLFDSTRKRPLPVRPATVAVITSPTGAVWRDICHVLARRWPLTRVLLVAAQVQGEAAPASLVGAFRKVERYAAARVSAGRPEEAPAVTILARGGGSLEDLWAFNDEAVVRAVVAHSVPVVCGVGHEVDVTLADFAADVRAPTPSAAAEVVVPDRADFLAAVRGGGRRLDGTIVTRLRATAREVVAERRALDRLSPVAQLAASRERVGLSLDRATRAMAGELDVRRRRVEHLGGRLGPTLPGRLGRERARLGRADGLDGLAVRRVATGRSSLGAATAALAVLGPQATLDRGYAIVRRTDDGRIVRDPADAPAGTGVALRVARGELPATIDDR
jgi:exodeoxyribonuclease VII large subunit